jgi:hypothetical protein
MTVPQSRTCGSMIHHAYMMETSPAYRESRFTIENASRSAERTMLAAPSSLAVLTIPVVIHVVFKNRTENISDEQIKSQIRILNEDYRMQNQDNLLVPDPFKPFKADAKIEFKLAVRDPDGKPTKGVTRTRTNKSSFSFNDDVKFSTTGGKNAWPADRYLNIWVCALGDNLLGYAQFPSDEPETDGVVILHTAFGNVGTAAAPGNPFNQGRTCTHEVGHWLNLRHIWGDDMGVCTGSDDIDDTPNQANANTGKPAFPRITCNNAPNGDMFMNYMDYVDDKAMFMFTKGQVVRMRATLDGSRAALKTSNALTPATT